MWRFAFREGAFEGIKTRSYGSFKHSALAKMEMELACNTEWLIYSLILPNLIEVHSFSKSVLEKELGLTDKTLTQYPMSHPIMIGMAYFVLMAVSRILIPILN